MRYFKPLGVTCVALAAAAMIGVVAYASDGSGAPAAKPGATSPASDISYAPWHKSLLLRRVADNCIDHGQTCTINGTPCCNAADSCKGKFPNTTCQ